MMPLIQKFEHLKIELEAIKSATNDFSDDNCIGKGGFGNVYKGELVHSKGRQTMVAIKRLNRAFGQGDPEFWKEIIMLSLYRHDNIVSLLGFCDDSGEKIVVYEYASRRSLDLYLNSADLTWVRRLKICIGAARGLAYLHNSVGRQQRVLHRDIKSSNILLDENWNARISDLGLSKFGPANQQYTFLVSNAVGTIGYCDPLYIETGLLTKESDVYSFGVVLFEVLCGRLCIRNNDDKHQPLTALVRFHCEQNKIDKLIHGSIKDEIHSTSLKAFTTIAYQCLNRDREARPLMAEVVRVLETALAYQLTTIGTAIQMDRQRENYKSSNEENLNLHFSRTDRERFELEELLSAEAEVLGRGSFGLSYKVMFSERLDLVVKRFKQISHENFHPHMRLLGNLSHSNLLPLVAFYDSKEEKLLITDFAVNGSLATHIHVDRKADELGLDWPTRLKILDWPIRLKIIQGVAKGLGYLYQELPDLSLPHGNLKSSNVLLDHNFNPLLGDYALTPIVNEKDAERLMVAYKSREFTEQKITTKKTDIWCLGNLILELMTGKSPEYLYSPEQKLEDGKLDLGAWVNSVGREEWSRKVFDKNMKWTKNNEIEMIDLLEIGLHCCEPDIARRWGPRKAFEKIQGLKEKEDDEDY